MTNFDIQFGKKNWEYLTDLLLGKKECLNSKFQKREKKLWTYIDPENAIVELDDLFINKNWKKKTLGTEKLTIPSKKCLMILKSSRQRYTPVYSEIKNK